MTSRARKKPELSRPDARRIYKLLLDRAPGDGDPVEEHVRSGSARTLVRTIVASPEYRAKSANSPFFFYNAAFDVEKVVLSHEDPNRKAVADHRVNYLGVAVHNRFLPFLADQPEVEGPPVPANWHGDMAEFGAALRAVDLARDTFTMIELGCGWGCWMNITGVAARRRGLKVKVIGVEGDEGHIDFAREALATNGFSEDEYVLHHGVAAARSGIALFPKQEQAGGDWGLEPIFGAEGDALAAALATGGYQQVEMVSLETVIGDNKRIDLLHIDIQGGEAALIHDCLNLLSERVAFVVIGTHSRQIEGDIMRDMLGAGWHLDVERPAIFTIENGTPVVTVDGVQGWRNPRLDAK